MAGRIGNLVTIDGRIPARVAARAGGRVRSARLAEVVAKLGRLETLRAELARMVANGCRGTPTDCRIIETLADHGHAHGLNAQHGFRDKEM